MFKPCPICKGWGVAKDEIGFNPIKCPQCFGKCIVDEETLRPVGHVESDLEAVGNEYWFPAKLEW